jgi:hypothetical protein
MFSAYITFRSPIIHQIPLLGFLFSPEIEITKEHEINKGENVQNENKKE